MKKISLLLITLFSAGAVMAQDFGSGMKIELKDGSVKSVSLSDITELSFSQVSFTDNYKSFPITIDPSKATTPDDANDECLNDKGEHGTDGYGLEGLFDPNKDRYFHSCYFEGHEYDETYNSYVEIDLQQSINNIAFEIAVRAGNIGWWAGSFPKHVKVYALNGSNWELIGNVEGVNDKIDPVTTYAPVGPFSTPYKFSKVRFSVVRGAGNKEMSGVLHVNEGYWSCGHMAVYGL